MKNKDTDCWGVFQFQSFRVKGGTKAQSKKEREVSEFQSFKVKEGTKALRHKAKNKKKFQSFKV